MASGVVPIDSEWAQEAIRRSSEGQGAEEIAYRVGKNAASVRKVLKAAREQGLLPADPIIEANTNGHAGSIPGQVDIDGGETAHEMDDGEVVYVEEIRVDGTVQLGFFRAGGMEPESSSLRLSGGKILLLDGKAFRKGDVIRFEGTAVVREVAQRDRPDPKTGVVVSAEQKHVAQITDLRVA